MEHLLINAKHFYRIHFLDRRPIIYSNRHKLIMKKKLEKQPHVNTEPQLTNQHSSVLLTEADIVLC